jgi:hypothetical protein
MSKKKTNARPTQLKTTATRSKRSGLNDARETKKFLQILGVCTLILVFLLYLIFMRSAG